MEQAAQIGERAGDGEDMTFHRIRLEISQTRDAQQKEMLRKCLPDPTDR
jgi:hypothetical protein